MLFLLRYLLKNAKRHAWTNISSIYEKEKSTENEQLYRKKIHEHMKIICEKKRELKTKKKDGIEKKNIFRK